VQRRNKTVFDATKLKKVVTKRNNIPPNVVEDLILASTAVKYTQSNSVGYAKDGMMVGIGAGQQSRVDCVKLAGRKVKTWYLRQHPKVLNLKFKSGIKRQERINARVQYIEGDFTSEGEIEAFNSLFEEVPVGLNEEEKIAFMKTLKGVSISSDAFFPFRDNIDTCARFGVEYVVQPGGSVKDDVVIASADSHGMFMAFSDLRMFHH